MNDLRRRSAVIFDPHPLSLEALERTLAHVGVDVVAKTTSPDQAVAAVAEHEVDLLVAEVQAPEAHGLDVLVRARASVPHLKAIALADEDDAALVARALRAGAIAYVVKTARPDDVAFAVRQAFEPSIYLAPPPSETRDERARALAAAGLTRREIDVLGRVSEGTSNADIARELWVTEQTVKFHLRNIYRKLGLSNRTEASRWAHEHRALT